MSPRIVAVGVAWAALVCAGTTSAQPASGDDTARAAALLQRFECGRCHEGTGLPPPPRNKACVGCHRLILQGRVGASPTAQARWRRDLVSLNQAPSLTTARRLRRAWLRRFLLDPVDVRPALRATMPRLDLTAAEADVLAAALTSDSADAPADSSPAQLAAGRAAFVASGCTACHRFSGAGVPSPPPVAFPAADAVALAPDLALTRQRMSLAAVERLLADGSGVDERLMPRFALAPAAARSLASFVIAAPLQAAAPMPQPRLPLLTRRVGWDEVYARVFHVCRHCHGEPELALGDGGPGNTGGFGFVGRGVDLSSATAAGRGALDAGRRVSLFAPLPDGTPRLIALLLARCAEEAGHPVAGLRGMPLALPALGPKELQLVESWVAQGRPR